MADDAVGGAGGAPDDLARSLLARVRAGSRSQPTPAGRRLRAVPRQPADRRSGAAADDRDPQLIGPLVDALVEQRGWEVPVAVGGVEGRWSAVVGPELAAHCQPESYDDGLLTVRADSTAWATQLRLLAPTLVARLNADLGDGTVTRVTVLGPAGPSWRKGRFRVKGRGPRDTYG